MKTLLVPRYWSGHLTKDHLSPRYPADSATETVHVVLPNDANPLGFILGGTVMHLIDIAGAIASHRHTHSRVATVAVDSLEFLNPVKVGDQIILRARITCAFRTSLEVAVEAWSEETVTGERHLTSRAFLTFVALDQDGRPTDVPPLILDNDEDRRRAEAAQGRRTERLKKRGNLASESFSF